MIINNKRALAHIQKIHDIQPIEGADRIELVHILGWTLIAKKGEFQDGELAVYIEIDSAVPADDKRFEFLAAKNFKVKTYKLNKFGVISQGLALPLSSFPELKDSEVGTDVTEVLHIKYSVAEDNHRKAAPISALVSLKARKPKLFTHKIIQWLVKREWGVKLVLKLWGSKEVSATAFPSKYCSPTDEERIQNIPDVLQIKTPFVVTEKLDGTSTTFVLVKHKNIFKTKYEFIVSSRNVRQLSPEQVCYHDTNVYWEMAIKYDIEHNMIEMLNNIPDAHYLVIQGETYGNNIQGNPYKIDDVRFAAFNIIDDAHGRWGSLEGRSYCSKFDIPWVPILAAEYKLPDTVNELLTAATGPSVINKNVLREGWVLRAPDGNLSFKAVSPEYLINKGE